MNPARIIYFFAWTIALLGFLLILISINTDYWITYDVATSPTLRSRYAGRPFTYDRSNGLFRECFLEPYPPPIEQAYTSAVAGSRCLNTIGRWLYPRSAGLQGQFEGYSHEDQAGLIFHSQLVWAHLITGAIGCMAVLLCLSLAILAGLYVGITRSLILTTAGFQVVGAIAYFGSMAIWHVAVLLRRDSIDVDGFPAAWPVQIKEFTVSYYDWSYMCAWAGILATLVAALLQLITYCLARGSNDDESHKPKLPLPEKESHRHLDPSSTWAGTTIDSTNLLWPPYSGTGSYYNSYNLQTMNPDPSVYTSDQWYATYHGAGRGETPHSRERSGNRRNRPVSVGDIAPGWNPVQGEPTGSSPNFSLKAEGHPIVTEPHSSCGGQTSYVTENLSSLGSRTNETLTKANDNNANNSSSDDDNKNASSHRLNNNTSKGRKNNKNDKRKGTRIDDKRGYNDNINNNYNDNPGHGCHIEGTGRKYVKNPGTKSSSPRKIDDTVHGRDIEAPKRVFGLQKQAVFTDK